LGVSKLTFTPQECFSTVDEFIEALNKTNEPHEVIEGLLIVQVKMGDGVKYVYDAATRMYLKHTRPKPEPHDFFGG